MEEANEPTAQVFDPAYFAANGFNEKKPLTGLGAGDSTLFFDVVQPEIFFEWVRNEVKWNEMFHHGGAVPRLVAVQGTLVNGHEPIYRHPTDEQPELVSWTPAVAELRNVVEQCIGQQLNHALIQYYRNGIDYISEHTDKTLDVTRGSKIVNLSLGASRVMVLRTKNKTDRIIQRITLPHNSLFVMGWDTNRRWTHEIRQDKRSNSIKRPDELKDTGQRISLTFRSVATFLRRSDNQLYGQGAKYKTEAELPASSAKQPSQIDQAKEQKAMLYAFSNENRDENFDWDKNYGCGFNCLNFKLIADRDR